MEFGMCVLTKLDEVDFAKRCENLGFDMLWVPDSQMIWADCYAYLALAAERTSRIKLATGEGVESAKERELFTASNKENFRVAGASVVTKENYSGGVFGSSRRNDHP